MLLLKRNRQIITRMFQQKQYITYLLIHNLHKAFRLQHSVTNALVILRVIVAKSFGTTSFLVYHGLFK